MKQPYVYRVVLPCTNAAKTTARLPSGEYISVYNGELYVIAESPTDVAEKLPDALSIVKVGQGIILVER